MIILLRVIKIQTIRKVTKVMEITIIIDADSGKITTECDAKFVVNLVTLHKGVIFYLKGSNRGMKTK